jgi:hypothetical protein
MKTETFIEYEHNGKTVKRKTSGTSHSGGFYKVKEGVKDVFIPAMMVERKITITDFNR